MTAFKIDVITELPDRIFVKVDQRFDVVIQRTKAGLSLFVYPRTNGESWMVHFTTFEVDEAEFTALETPREE